MDHEKFFIYLLSIMWLVAAAAIEFIKVVMSALEDKTWT